MGKYKQAYSVRNRVRSLIKSWPKAAIKIKRGVRLVYIRRENKE